MKTQKLSVLIYNENIDLFKDIIGILETDGLHYIGVTDLNDLDDKLQEKQFDLFICLLKDFSGDFQESISTIKHEYSNLFICVISESGYIENPAVDCFCRRELLQSITYLEEVISNLTRLAERQKNQIELSAMLLHDLRSPVQNIFGYMELLEQGVFGSISPGQKQILLNALSLGDTIIELMDDLSQSFQLEYRGLSFIKTAVSPKEVVDETLRSMWVQADKKNIKLLSQVAGNLPDIDGDYLSIQRIFHNLINNAIKFTPDGGRVSLDINQYSEDDGPDCYEVTVSDSGIGIPKERLDQLFRMDNTSTTKGTANESGTGLGLLLCYDFVILYQ